MYIRTKLISQALVIKRMRPNIDISWSLHGDIKEYSERTDKSLEEAYVDVIQRGLGSVSDRTRQFTMNQPPDVVFSPIDEDVGVRAAVLFSPFSAGIYDDPAVIRVLEHDLPVEDAEGILSELYHQFVLDDGSYSIHQPNAGWYGEGGVDDFFYWLDNQHELYENVPDTFEIEYHRTAAAAFISAAPHPARHVLVYATPNRHGTLEKFGIEFVIDGFPIDGGAFADFAETVGVDLSHAATWSADYEAAQEFERVDIGDDGPFGLDRKLTRQDDEEVIEGIVCDNPFYSNVDAVERTFDDTDIQRAVGGVKILRGRLKHTVDEDMDYDLYTTRFGCYNLLFLTDAPFTIVNVNFEANW